MFPYLSQNISWLTARDTPPTFVETEVLEWLNPLVLLETAVLDPPFDKDFFGYVPKNIKFYE